MMYHQECAKHFLQHMLDDLSSEQGSPFSRTVQTGDGKDIRSNRPIGTSVAPQSSRGFWSPFSRTVQTGDGKEISRNEYDDLKRTNIVLRDDLYKAQRACEDIKINHKKREEEMEAHYKDEVCKAKEEEMEAHYRDELRKADEECDKMKMKYENLHKRVTTEISKDFGRRGNAFEDLSDPCNETRLREMYDELRIKNLPTLTRTMKSMTAQKKTNAGFAESWKNLFEQARHNMKVQTDCLKDIFIADEQQKNEKILQNLASATHRLKEVFHHRSDTYYENIVRPMCQGKETADMLNLSAKYYKLMCLMHLHNPPMEPDWQKAEGPQLGIEERLFPPIKMLLPVSLRVEEGKKTPQPSGWFADDTVRMDTM
ncbi:uncharacterized protein LOC134078662 isoform X3 [Sardina pilchardus]|uniref:uncharacterized protein LOC134078662 isoform X3 n=1 Tax=Sardina pilchardus TaxID=27697 RepID=UPI002E0E7D34